MKPWTVDPEESDLGVMVNHEGHEVALLPWDAARDLARYVNLSIEAAVAAEREACAVVAEDAWTYSPPIAAAIRGRGAR